MVWNRLALACGEIEVSRPDPNEARDSYGYAERVLESRKAHESAKLAKQEQEAKDNAPVNIADYGGLKDGEPATAVIDDGCIRASVAEINLNGSLRLHIEEAGPLWLKHIHVGKTYTFNLHRRDEPDEDWTVWSLRDEEHECAQRHGDGSVSYGADLLLYFDDGNFTLYEKGQGLLRPRRQEADSEACPDPSGLLRGEPEGSVPARGSGFDRLE